LAFAVIITGIVTYTVNPPKAADVLNIAHSKQSPVTRAPVTLMSVSYQNGANVSHSAAAEAQVASLVNTDTCTDQLMSRHDIDSQPVDECEKS